MVGDTPSLSSACLWLRRALVLRVHTAAGKVRQPFGALRELSTPTKQSHEPESR